MKLLRLFKIKYRLIAIFLLVSIVPIFIVGYSSYHIYSDSIIRKLNKSTEQSIALIRKNILVEVEKYEYLSSSISIIPAVQDSLELPKSVYSYGDSRNKIDNAIQSIGHHPYLKNVRIIKNNGEIIYDLGYDNITDNQLKSIIDDVDKKSPKDSWSYVSTFRNSDILIDGRKINLASDYTSPLGYMLLFIDEKLFSKTILSDIDLGTNASLLLMSSDGNILSSSDQTVPLGKPYIDSSLLEEITKNYSNKNQAFEHSFENEDEMISFVPIERMDCFLVAKIPFSYIYSETVAIKRTINILVAIITFICLIIITALYGSIMNPIHSIVSSCNSTSAGDLSARIHDYNPDEIGFLANNIDLMVDKIEQLMIQQEHDQKRKRTLELQMLQHQINPHFLFNTLNTFKWIAVINKVDVVSNGIGALSDLLKSTIINKNEYITLQEEIDNLKNYFEIQKIRYADSFTVIYDLDETLLDSTVLKFILQPIVENAIIHGIDGNNITITICCKSENNCLIIDLIDDGTGFNSSELDLTSSKKLTGIGVSNVNERLKLSFGPEYGLTINSEIGHGTWCHIKMPLNFKEEGSILDA